MYSADARHPNASLEAKLQSLYGLHGGAAIDLSFRPPYARLLKAFGDPHRHLPPVVHVAGTNGKGSVIALLRAMLEAAGYRIHVYSSPHLVRFNERIVLAGREIDDNMLEGLIDEALRLNDGDGLTFFEITTAIAFAAFARTPADILLLETGLGGRLDCTNIVPDHAVSIITGIGYDHMEFLGGTIEAIAREKAGIIKPGRPCVMGPQRHDTALETLRKAAYTQGSAPFAGGSDWRIEPQGNRVFRFISGSYAETLPFPSLAGRHQLENAGTALAALQRLDGFTVPATARAAGLQAAHWPARMQGLPPVAFGLPDDWGVWLDGGHNEDAAQALAATIRDWRADHPEQPVHMVTAMLNRRDPATFLAPLLPFCDSLSVCTIPDEPSAHTIEDLRNAALRASFDPGRLYTAPDPVEAVRRLPMHAGSAASRVLIAGSLYLAGAVLRRIPTPVPQSVTSAP